MKKYSKKVIVWLLILCMILPNGFTAYAYTENGIELEDNDSGKTALWSSSFEDPAGFTANTLDEKGNQNLQPVSTNALVGDITYLVDLTSISGSANYNSNETKEKLFDSNSGTKFLSNVPQPVTVSWSLTGKVLKTVNQYVIVSANDAVERDPKSWQLYGKKEGDADYTLIDERTDQTFSARYQSNLYAVTAPGAYSSYKLVITRNASTSGTTGMTQFADLILSTGNSADNQYQLDGMSVDISNGPSSTWNQTSNAGWTGSKALKATGSVTGQDAYAYNKIYGGLSIPVSEDTYFQYCIFPSMSNGNIYDYQYTQMYMSMDLKFTDGTYLSELNAFDQNHNGLDAVSQGDSKTLTTNQWNQIYSNIGSVARGKTIEAVLVDYNKPNHDMSGLKDFTTYFDDVQIYKKAPINIEHLSDYTNILRGTNDSSSFSRGLTAPAVTLPHGFNFWVPATNNNDNKMYDYQDTSLRFMTISHEPSYWVGDRGTWQFMVNTSLNAASAGSYALGSLASDFSHEKEIAHADYYSVEFDKVKGASAGSRLELTPTEHGAVVRYTFDNGVTNRNVIFDCIRAGGDVTYDNSGGVTTFQGYSDHTGNGSKRMYVYGAFDKKAVLTKESAKGGIASFGDDVVEMKIATSYLSYEQAKRNLELEIAPEENFDDIYVKAQTTWDDKLNTISGVQGATYEQLVTLYSNLYRLFAYPNTMSENTGTNSAPVWQYKSPYREDSAAPVDGQIYINNGFWDTYRTAWAAYGLLTPTDATQILNGLLQHYYDQGWVPRWIAPGGTNSMVGTNSDAIFADALVKGINFDVDAAYASALRNAATVSSNLTNGGRKNLNTALFLGYNPGTSEDFSWSMESYINDYGISQMAKTLADRETDFAKKTQYLAEYEYYLNRSKNYVKLFNNTGSTSLDQWFRGKDSSGEWTTSNFTDGSFDPFYWGENYTETNAYNMAVSVPQDGQGLANLYGGLDGLADKLDSVFETNGIYNGYGAANSVGGIHEQKEAREIKLGQYGHSNQPSHHIIYMYDYAAQPWKTQKYVRDVLDRAYVGATFGQGYIGDEDNGEMSAWYIFSALGFYPLNMGSDEFAIGSPLFDLVTVNLQNGSTLTVKAENNSKENVYIQSMKLNGADYNKAYIKFADISNGGTIEFTMGDQPNEAWGTGVGDLPSSITALEEEVKVYDDMTSPNVSVENTDTITTDMVFQDRLASTVTNVKNLVDNNSGSENSLSGGATINYSLDKAKKAELFTITSGKSNTAPASVQVYGAKENGEWQELASYDNLIFQWSQYTRPFLIPEEKQDFYSHYKLVFSAGTVSEIELLGYDDGARNKEDLGKLIQAARLIDQTGMLEVLKAKLNSAIDAAAAVYENSSSTNTEYTEAYNSLKKALETINGNLTNAYQRMEAENFASGNVVIDLKNGIPNNIGGVKKDYWASYKNVLFAGNTNFFEMNYAAQGSDGGGYAEIYLDDMNSSPVGVIQTPVTAATGWADYVTVNTAIAPTVTGLHDVYLVFRNDGTHAYVANVDWFRFDAILSVSATAGEHGTIDFTNHDIAYGQSITFNIDPEDGYVIDQVLVNGEASGFRGNGSESVQYTLSDIKADTTIAITFRPIENGSAPVAGIEIISYPTKLVYYVNDPLDLNGMEVLATYTDGTSAIVNDYLVDTVNPTSMAGITAVTISYEGATAGFQITVKERVPQNGTTKLEITKDPDKLMYKVGEELDLTGMEVVATYGDGSTGIVNDYQVVTPNPTIRAGTVTVTISYDGYTASYVIMVIDDNPPAPAITNLQITKNPNKLVYEIGDSLNLSGMEVVATYSDGSTAVINDYEVVTQNPTRAAGRVTITISYEGKSASYQITVKKHTYTPPAVILTGIAITKNPDKLIFNVGELLDLSGMEIKAAYSDGTTSIINGYTVVTQNATGTAGKVTVTIAYSGYSVSFEINVSLLPNAIVLNESQKTLLMKESFTLVPTLSPSGAVSKVEYSSSNSSVAEVSSEGVIKAKAAGTAVITASTENGLKADCTITVQSEVNSIKLNVKKKTLGVGEKFRLTYTFSPKDSFSKVTFSSGNKAVAVVSSTGVITPKRVGTAKITVKTANGKTAICTITVKKAPASIKVNNKVVTINVKKTYQLKTTLNKGAEGKITYKSSNTAVVSVDSIGKLLGKKKGTAVIIAMTYNGRSAKIRVTVK